MKKRQYVRGDKVITEVLIPAGTVVDLPKQNEPGNLGYRLLKDLWVKQDDIDSYSEELCQRVSTQKQKI